MLDQAFEALKEYNWGTDPKVLNPIDEAIVSSHGDQSARQALETRLAAVLGTDVPRDAKDYVCRKLMLIGSAESVSALATLLSNQDNSHMARYALERIPAPEAAAAMRDALPNINDPLKIGVIASLGVRGDTASIPLLSSYMSDENAAVAAAAAYALGDLATSAAAKALTEPGYRASEQVVFAATDASLSCAEALLADGKNSEALAIYKGYIGLNHPKHVRLAATRGMLACSGKK
ncbi:MAG: HEAT repeat domain-containing protein [Pirellulaceae bacterium]|nr:HEAT repeat domain-containing protein [Pirellulaceae bacterium]